jgi:hypothetical protein
MSKPNPLDMKHVKTSRYEISEDELLARMDQQQKLHVEPIQRAVALLEEALTQVLSGLGVDCTKDKEDISKQQDDLGITIWEHTDERSPQINGFFIHVDYGDFTPYAWVGGAKLNHEGKCFCDIQYFMTEKLETKGGFKLVQ